MRKRSNRKTWRGLAACLLVTIVLVAVSGAAAAFKNLKVGDQALPLELKDLDGQDHSLAKYRESKGVLLFFWSTWSDRAMKELDDLKRLQEDYGGKGLQILAINVDKPEISASDLEAVRTVARDKAPGFPVLVDHGLKVYNEWGVIATPTTALVDQSGSVVFDLSSYPTSGYDDIEVAVQKALGLYQEKAPSAAREAGYQPTKEAMLHLGLGKRLLEKGFGQKALPEFQMAAEADSGFADPRLYIGYALIKEGKAGEAEAPLRRAMELDAARAEARLLAAYALADQGKFDEAIALAQAAPAPAAAGTAAPAGPDLSKAQALKGEGKAPEARDALLAALGDELARTGFSIGKKKMDSAERLKMMMQGKGAP